MNAQASGYVVLVLLQGSSQVCTESLKLISSEGGSSFSYRNAESEIDGFELIQLHY